MSDYKEFNIEIMKKETPKAWIVQIEGIDRCVPKSISKIEGDKIQIPNWFCKKMDTSGEVYSEDKKNRYALWQIWNPRKRLILCIGLNPTGGQKSPTVTRLASTLDKMGFGGFYLCNLFTFISSEPEVLMHPDIQAQEDRDMGILFAYSMICQDVIFCWGTFDEAKSRAERVIGFFENGLCFGKNKDESPWHPMALMYAGLKPGRVPIHRFRDHQYKDNTYNRKISKKMKEAAYNAKQLSITI